MAKGFSFRFSSIQLFRKGWWHFVLAGSALSAQPRSQQESWFASRYSRRESVVHCRRQRAKPRRRRVLQRTEERLCAGPLRDPLPLAAVVFVFPGIEPVSCKSLFHSCNEDSQR